MHQYSIKFDHVFVGYGKKTILHNISLKVKKGNVVAVIGNSGAGKSTGIRCMTAQIQPRIGNARTSGLDVKNSEVVQATIGYVPQLEHVSLYMNFSAEKNALFFGRNYGIPDERIKSRCREIMEILGLGQDEFIKKKVKFLSGGEKKRVSIMVGLISDPEVLFLDEPTTGLDPHLRIEVLNFLYKINQKYNTTIMIVSHDLECVDYCNQVIIFSDGMLVDSDHPHNLIKRLPNNGKAYDLQFKELSIDDEGYISSISEIKSLLHVGRNKFRIFIDSDDELTVIQTKILEKNLEILKRTPIDCTFLDYFRIQSKYKYPDMTLKLKKEALEFQKQQKEMKTNGIKTPIKSSNQIIL